MCVAQEMLLQKTTGRPRSPAKRRTCGLKWASGSSGPPCSDLPRADHHIREAWRHRDQFGLRNPHPNDRYLWRHLTGRRSARRCTPEGKVSRQTCIFLVPSGLATDASWPATSRAQTRASITEGVRRQVERRAGRDHWRGSAWQDIDAARLDRRWPSHRRRSVAGAEVMSSAG